MPPTSAEDDASAAQALSAAADLPDDGETQVILFAGTTANEFLAQRLNPTESLAAGFRDIARDFASDALRKRTPVRYSAGRRPSSYEIAFTSRASIPTLQQVLAQAEAPLELELFEGETAIAESLRFYVVAIRRPNPGWVHFIRAKGFTLRLKRTRKLAAVLRGAAYDELEEDPLIFDAGFDAIVANDVVLVVNQGSFERSLGFVEQAQDLARATLNQLLTTLGVSNADEFVAAGSSDLNMVSKVRSIAEKMSSRPAYAAAMTTDRLIAFAQERRLEIDVEEIDGVQKLVFHTDPQRRWRILKLLDDDYLHSQLTETDYEVNSKSPLEL